MSFFGRNKTVVGLDIGSHSVKAVELTRTGDGLVMTAFGRAEIDMPESIPGILQQLWRDAGIRCKKVITGVSGRSVIVRYVPMQTMDDEELKQAIHYEADKYIPFEVDEVVLDCQRMDTETVSADQMRVVLVAVKRTLVDDQVGILQQAGFQPQIIDADQFAIGNAFELRSERMRQIDQNVRGLVEIGASKTTINIMRGTTSAFTREFFAAGNDLTEAVAKRFGEDPADVEKMKENPGDALETMQDAIMQVLEDIGSEIRLSFDYYENQYDQEVQEVYLSGGSVKFPGMDTMLANIFNMETKLWDPMEAVEVSPETAARLSGLNSDYAVAVGLAARLRSM